MIIIGAIVIILVIILVLIFDMFISTKIADYLDSKYEDCFGVGLSGSMFIILIMELAIIFQVIS